MSTQATISIPQKENHTTIVYPFYTTAQNFLGSIVILHGMAEHHARYHAFAAFLNDQGFDVYLYDHRGHGTDKKTEDLGFFAPKCGYRLVIGDAIQVLKYVKKNGRSNRLILFGHSMGSLIARNVIQHYDEMDAAIFCGTAAPAPVVSLAGIGLASVICKGKGERNPSPFLNMLLFSGPQYKKLCTHTLFDWLTRDQTVVEQYEADPYCGYLCTASFYRDLIRLTLLARKKKGIDKTRKDLPIFFLAGEKDPVGGYGKQVEGIYRIFQTLNFKDVSLKLYPEARHELLNELNKDEVMHDIVTWLNKF